MTEKRAQTVVNLDTMIYKKTDEIVTWVNYVPETEKEGIAPCRFKIRYSSYQDLKALSGVEQMDPKAPTINDNLLEGMQEAAEKVLVDWELSLEQFAALVPVKNEVTDENRHFTVPFEKPAIQFLLAHVLLLPMFIFNSSREASLFNETNLVKN